MLLISPSVSVFADGPVSLRDQGTELDGHPWDDNTDESATDPGADPNTPGQTPSTGTSVTDSNPASALMGSGAQMVAKLFSIVTERWIRTVEIKVVKSRSVQRER
jgi:hypothetical protein